MLLPFVTIIAHLINRQGKIAPVVDVTCVFDEDDDAMSNCLCGLKTCSPCSPGTGTMGLRMQPTKNQYPLLKFSSGFALCDKDEMYTRIEERLSD